MTDDELLKLIRQFNRGVEAQRDEPTALLRLAADVSCSTCERVIGSVTPETACDQCAAAVRAMHRLADAVEDLTHVPEWLAT